MFKLSPIVLVFISTVAVAGEQLLSGEQIREKIVHNTLVGSEDGAPVVEYFNDDGFILGRGKDGKYIGLWRIRGNKLCVDYDDDDEANGKVTEAMDCMAIALNGDKVTRLSGDDSVDDDDNDDIWTLKQGNPELLTSDTDDD